ncbi:hypothetical protein [Flavobacterium sp. JP2137]|uniref:hypothetical protein n=1 Tax=Flavobacterium sp. JP2137 TaxID=3414510 RepID=UPI003D301693
MRVLIILILFGCIGCRQNFSRNTESLKSINNTYTRFKNNFKSVLIEHFPEKITHSESSVSSVTDLRRDDLGLYLYQYNVQEKHIDSLEISLFDLGFIEKYNSKDNCVLKVNPFETKGMNLENKKPIIDKNLSIEKLCFENKLPIPNFVDFNINSNTDFWKDGNFDIYVFGAEKGIFYNGLELVSEQMPKEWGNGYSKGIAISREQKIVIYWMVIW